MKNLVFQGITAPVVLLFSICAFGAEPVESTVPSNEKIHQILTERDFFLKFIDAQITFETKDSGQATALILHQNGQKPRAPKIEE